MARLWRIELIYADDGIAMIYTVQFLPSRKVKVTIIVIFECRFGFSNPELGGKHTIDVYFCLVDVPGTGCAIFAGCYYKCYS